MPTTCATAWWTSSCAGVGGSGGWTTGWGRVARPSAPGARPPGRGRKRLLEMDDPLERLEFVRDTLYELGMLPDDPDAPLTR